MTRTTNMPCLLAVILVFGMSPLRAAAQSVDDVLNTAWEMFWQQSGYPRAVYKWRTPIRVRFSGAFGERQKVFAMERHS